MRSEEEEKERRRRMTEEDNCNRSSVVDYFVITSLARDHCIVKLV